MRIILLIDSLGGGGAQRQMVMLANQLAANKHQVNLLIYNDNLQLVGMLDMDNVKFDLINKKSKFDLLFLWRLYKHVKIFKPKIIVSYLNTPNLYARIIGRLTNTEKIVTSERNIDLVYSKLRMFFEHVFGPLSDVIVVNSISAKEMYLRNFPNLSARVQVIYNGVDDSLFKKYKEPKKISTNPALIGLDEKKKVICLPGRIEKQKNHKLLLEAYKSLPNGIRDHSQILFIGNQTDSQLYSELLNLVREYEMESSVIFCQHYDDMTDIYNLSDVVVLPSLYEGFPNVVIEAMLCSTVVIASSVSDLPILIDNAESGYLFNSGDKVQLTSLLSKVLEMDAQKASVIGSSARKKASEMCSVIKFNAEYERVLGLKG